MKNKTCIILRGCPGSGKSTFAETIADENTVVCCADDYFVKDGVYQFDRKKIKEAHEYCLDKFSKAILAEKNIIVANTNSQEWEFRKYLDCAELYGYTTHVLIVENRHGQENIHGCPDETVALMARRIWNSIKLV